MDYKPFCRTEIIFTNLQTLKKQLLSMNVVNIVLVMSESSVSRYDMIPFIRNLQEKCEVQKGTFTWVDTVTPNPNPGDIARCLMKIGDSQVDVIIAMGGGSAIDLAKAISAFHNGTSCFTCTADKIIDGIKNKRYRNGTFIDIIAVPSTAGTGSEVTQWATVWDENKAYKYSIDEPGLKPRMAFIVPELMVSMEPELTLATGLDAICQAIEAYWSIHTTPVVQEIACRAINIGIQNLKKAVDCPEDLKIRENLCKASVLSGLAFSQTRTTACHSISYPLTMLYGIPHGLAASITLDAVGKINKGHFPNDDVLFNLFKDYNGILGFIDWVCADVIKMRLSYYGITEKDIPAIVDKAFTAGRMDNNPVDLTEKDVTLILKGIM